MQIKCLYVIFTPDADERLRNGKFVFFILRNNEDGFVEDEN